MLRLENVTTGYSKRQVLFDISFEINKGEIVLLIGANGSGKSTVLKYIYGLLPPFAGGFGKVFFDGADITRTKTSELIKKGLVYIPQKDNVFDNLSVKDNLEVAGLPLNNKKLYDERYEEVLMLFPILRALLKRMPIKLSGGERQLLALAMASLHKPKMILADEPFAGLSHRNIEIVKLQIITINKQLNTTFLVVEHKVKESYGITNRIIGLKLGQLNKIFTTNYDLKHNDLNSIFV